MSFLAKLAIKLFINLLIVGGSAVIVFLLLFAPNMNMVFYTLSENKYNGVFDSALVQTCQQNKEGVFCAEKTSPDLEAGGVKVYDLSYIPKDPKLYNAVLAISLAENSQRVTKGDRDSCGGYQQRLSEIISPDNQKYFDASAILRERGKNVSDYITTEERELLNNQVEADRDNNNPNMSNYGVTNANTSGTAKYYKGFETICKRWVEKLGNAFFDQMQVKRFEREKVWGDGKQLQDLDIDSPNYINEMIEIILPTHRPSEAEQPKWRQRIRDRFTPIYKTAFANAQTKCGCPNKVSCIPKKSNNLNN
jgi:hypothetical protein